MTDSDSGTALVLSGGGARAAYQVGALRALAELLPTEIAFPIITGISAGAINGAFLAQYGERFRDATSAAWDLWADLRPEDVFHTGSISLTKIGLRWLVGVGLGEFMGKHKPNFLLDTAPLRRLLGLRVAFDSITKKIDEGQLRGIAFSASSYQNGDTVTFFDGSPGIRSRPNGRHPFMRTRISADHILASSSIPIFFRPIRIGDTYFGDGGIRYTAPLSPAIFLGARRILTIGIRSSPENQYVPRIRAPQPVSPPSLADLAGTLLNAIFLEALQSDVDRLDRINREIQLLSRAKLASGWVRRKFIPYLYLHPSMDLGSLAYQLHDTFPSPLKYLVRGLGVSSRKSWDFLSYLSFDRSYTRRLLDLGYRDTMKRRREVLGFFSRSSFVDMLASSGK